MKRMIPKTTLSSIANYHRKKLASKVLVKRGGEKLKNVKPVSYSERGRD